MKTKETALALVRTDISPVQREASILTIKSTADQNKAAELLSRLNKFNDTVIAYKKSKTDPLNKALKIIRAETKPLEDALDTSIENLREKMGTYQLEAEREAEEEEDKIAARVGEGKGHLKPETAVAKMDEIERPDAVVETQSGSVKFRTDRKLKIVSLQKVMTHIFNNHLLTLVELKENALLAFLKEGYSVDGAQVEEVKTPINSR